MHRFLLLSSFFISLLLLPVGSRAAFSDVATSHPYYYAINWAQSEEIVNGYADGSFRPNATINRAEFTKIVMGSNFTSAAVSLCDPNHVYSFTDAGKSEWYSPYLCLAAQHRIIGGYPDGSFRPENSINFVEAAKIIAITSQYRNGVSGADSQRFSVAPGQEWYEPYVEYLSEEDVIPRSIGSNADLVTRGEMVEMMYRLSDSFHAPDTAAGGWKTYEDIHGIYSMQLPDNWLALSPYDGSFLSFTKLGDGVMGYGSPEGRTEIFLEAFRMEDIYLQPGETLLEFARNRYCPPDRCSFRTRQEEGYRIHDLMITDPKPEYVLTGYTLFERDDAFVAFGYGISSTTTTAIQRSFRFTPKNLLR